MMQPRCGARRRFRLRRSLPVVLDLVDIGSDLDLDSIDDGLECPAVYLRNDILLNWSVTVNLIAPLCA